MRIVTPAALRELSSMTREKYQDQSHPFHKLCEIFDGCANEIESRDAEIDGLRRAAVDDELESERYVGLWLTVENKGRKKGVMLAAACIRGIAKGLEAAGMVLMAQPERNEPELHAVDLELVAKRVEELASS